MLSYCFGEVIAVESSRYSAVLVSIVLDKFLPLKVSRMCNPREVSDIRFCNGFLKGIYVWLSF